MKLECLTTEMREIDVEKLTKQYPVTFQLIDANLLRADGLGAEIIVTYPDDDEPRHITCYLDGHGLGIEDCDGCELTDDEERFIVALTEKMIGLA